MPARFAAFGLPSARLWPFAGRLNRGFNAPRRLGQCLPLGSSLALNASRRPCRPFAAFGLPLVTTQLAHTPLVITQLVQDAAGCWRGRRGTLRHPVPLCVAGVARTGGVAGVAGVAGTSAVALALLHTL